jgi:nucleoside 2-deoxyribosyltransferase
MKIYFACSIRRGRDDTTTYAALVAHIMTRADVLSEASAASSLTDKGMNKPSSVIWRTDTDWIRAADGVIAEVTNPGLG